MQKLWHHKKPLKVFKSKTIVDTYRSIQSSNIKLIYIKQNLMVGTSIHLSNDIEIMIASHIQNGWEN